jgi:hypothetical protein
MLAMDEVETVFDTAFRSDFFGMLRSWHNSRVPTSPAWIKLDLALVTSTEPYDQCSGKAAREGRRAACPTGATSPPGWAPPAHHTPAFPAMAF